MPIPVFAQPAAKPWSQENRRGTHSQDGITWTGLVEPGKYNQHGVLEDVPHVSLHLVWLGL